MADAPIPFKLTRAARPIPFRLSVAPTSTGLEHFVVPEGAKPMPHEEAWEIVKQDLPKPAWSETRLAQRPVKPGPVEPDIVPLAEAQRLVAGAR
jgi:hypothetical protein